MWLLLFFIFVDDHWSSYRLETYADEQTCLSEKIRVFEGLKMAYPDDDSFYVVCRLKEEV